MAIRDWLGFKDALDEPGELGASGRTRASLIDEAFRLYNRPLFRFARGQFLSNQEAEDVVQDAYARFCAVENPSSIGSVKAFLFTTARNLIIDLKRRKQVRINYQELEWSDESADPNTAEQELERDRQLARLKEAVDGLPPRCRDVFVLHRFEHRPHREIAEMLGITTHAVEKHLSRALKRCQEAMQER